MHPALHAQTHPDQPAIIMGVSGEVETFAELDRASNQGAQLFRACGLQPGDTMAIMMENHPRYLDVAWAAQRAGLHFVCISSKLTLPEVVYILEDSGSKLIVTSPAMTKAIGGLVEEKPDLIRFMVDDPAPGFRSWRDETAALPATPIADERGGVDMLYSSGTTGRPKGVRPALPEDPDIAAPTGISMIAEAMFGFGEGSVYICPAPLYHAAPLRWSMTVQKLGGTVVVMERYDPELALQLIERHKVTHSQWVPTHFVRMLKLDDEVRAKYDLSSLKLAIHAAAPCPVPVKKAMIEWWGPVLVEYYAGTEGNGMTLITSEDWLEHPGSVGRAVNCLVHICDPDGDPVPARQEGNVFFEGGAEFTYHNDPGKTQDSRNKHGWSTLGDIGWVDEDGYLFLTDRKSFMIISGGVNIYPQEIENLLVTHPKVMDAAVVGAPDPEMGEKVVAVIQPIDWADANDDFAEELRQWLRPQLSGVKMPRQIDFLEELPRHATGKLYKRLLRDKYWGKHDTTVV